ncbi:hypothetical protein BVX99_00925 [bacterium F16]|nr:hypothetical protein BVX99_00925 [bacterium F16]
MDEGTRNVLFVDDEPNVLSGLRRLLFSEKKHWDMHFANSGSEALVLMEGRTFDVVVSDLRMPKMDGIQFLEAVKERHPKCIRFILSGYADKDMLLRSIGPTHQFLTKPCDPDLLKSKIRRALDLRRLFMEEKAPQILKAITRVPILPMVYKELTTLIQSGQANASNIAEVISRDIGISAKILQLVNSAFFGLPRSVSDVSTAVSLLGLETITGVIMTVNAFDSFTETEVQELGLDSLYNHSILTGYYSQFICKELMHDKKAAEEAQLAGMTHDVGKLLFMKSGSTLWSKLYAQSRHENLDLWTLERKELSITHAELGAYLLGVWGMADNITEAVAFYHVPSKCCNQGLSVLTAVHLANVLSKCDSLDAFRRHPGLDRSYLSKIPELKKTLPPIIKTLLENSVT